MWSLIWKALKLFSLETAPETVAVKSEQRLDLTAEYSLGTRPTSTRPQPVAHNGSSPAVTALAARTNHCLPWPGPLRRAYLQSNPQRRSLPPSPPHQPKAVKAPRPITSLPLSP